MSQRDFFVEAENKATEMKVTIYGIVRRSFGENVVITWSTLDSSVAPIMMMEAVTTGRGFPRPRKTATRAIHPLPAVMLPTKAPSGREREAPASPKKIPAIV